MFDGEVGSLNKRKVSLRGKSGREGSAKDTIDKARKERAFRAAERKHNDNAKLLQSWYRGRSIAFRARNQCRNDLVSKLHDLQRVEAAMALARGDSNNLVVPLTILTRLIRQTIFIFEATIDAATVSVVCKRLLQAPTALENVRDTVGLLCMRRLACICLFLVAEQGLEKSVLEVLRQLCMSEVVAEPVRSSILQGLGNGEGMVIRCGPPSFQLVQPNLLKYIATSNRLSFSSFSVLCNCALALLRELGEDKNVAAQVSQTLLPAEGLMKPGSQLYTNLILQMVNHPWAKCAWLSAFSLIDSAFVSKMGLTAGACALVNVLKLHQMFRTESSNNNEGRVIWACVSHLLQPEIFFILAGNDKPQEMSSGGESSNSSCESELSELEEEETLELRYIIRQKLSRTMTTIPSFSNEAHDLAVEALLSLINPAEALQQLDALPSVSFAPGSVQKTLDYSVRGSPETSLIDDGALSVCAVYGELVAWGDLSIDQMSNKRFVSQQSQQHSSSEGDWRRSIRQMVSVLAYGRSKNSLVARLWWHLKNRWRVELVISQGVNAGATLLKQKKTGHGSSSSKMSHTELRNVGSSRTSQLVCVLLLFCATYHLQLVGLDDQDFFEKGVPLPIEEVCCVIEFLRNWLLEACWKSPLLDSDPPLFHVELRLFESAVGLYNALHDRWSRRPYAKPEIWNWPNLNRESLFPESSFPHSTESFVNKRLHEVESFYFGGSRPLPVILVNIPQVIPFNQRLLIFRELTKADRKDRLHRDVVSSFAPQSGGGGIIQNGTHAVSQQHNRRNERPGSQFQSFFGIPDAPSGPSDRSPGSELSTIDEFDEPQPQFQEDFRRPNYLRVRRNELYKDSLEGLADTNMQEPMRIEMVNEHGMVEPGIDGGGVFKEWINSLTKCAFSTEYGLWVETSERLLFPNPKASTRLNEYKFCGRILGKAVLLGILVEPLFSFPFLNSLLDRQNYIDELYTLDASLYHSLMGLKSYAATDGNDVKDLYLTFSVDRPVQEEVNGNQEERGAASHNRMRSVNLVPGGERIEVTNENVSFYIHAMGHFILNVECRYQCRAFISGFREVISRNWVCLFSPQELQRLVGGDNLTSLDVKNLMENTIYGGGYHPSQPYIQAFWDFVEHMDPHDQAALLQFVTSCSRQPLLGFEELHPRFCIQKVQIADTEGRDVKLPTSSTCVNLLKLPKYDNIETMRNKLLYSIHSGEGFELT
eukprot:212537_1